MSLSYLPFSDDQNPDRDELIDKYFSLGFKYEEILGFLCTYQSCVLSLVQLKRILKRLGLGRRGRSKDNIQSVMNVIRVELLAHKGFHIEVK